MDYNNPLGVEYRVVNDGEHLGQPVRMVSGARTYDADIDDLWDAVTNPERIPRWFAPVTGRLELNGDYQIEGNAGGRITHCEKPTAFDLTWECGGNTSWVTVRLETVDDGTRLTLAHLMGKDADSEAHWKKYGPGATGVGWDLGFLALGLHLKDVEAILNEQDHNAWLASEAGKVFLKGCAEAWGHAHVELGEAQEVAVAMARATAAFYCGEEHAS